MFIHWRNCKLWLRRWWIRPLFICAVYLVLCCSTTISQEKVSQEKYVDLVNSLGSPSFQAREQAAQRLLAEGPKASSAIRAGAANPDHETRLRCRELLVLIGELHKEQLLKAFARGATQNETRSNDFPAWDQLLAALGEDNQQTRRLYVRIAKTESSLLESLDGPSSRTWQAILDRLQQSPGESRRNPFDEKQQLSIPALAAMLVGALKLDGQPQDFCTQLLKRHLDEGGAERKIRADENSAQLKTLISAWLISSVTTPSARQETDEFIDVALRYTAHDAALQLARRLVENPHLGAYHLPKAIVVLGRFGNREDIARLTPLLTNTRSFHITGSKTTNLEPTGGRQAGGGRGILRVEVRDVALAALVQLTGQNHKEYGFDDLTDFDQQAALIHPLSMGSRSKRARGMVKWTQWSRRHQLDTKKR